MNQISIYSNTCKIHREPSICCPSIKEINNCAVCIHNWTANCPLRYSTSWPDGNSLGSLHLEKAGNIKSDEIKRMPSTIT